MTAHPDCELLVAGGGVAGAAAAVAAARAGIRTLLVEPDDFLGGTGQAGLFRTICGLYTETAGTPSTTLNNGIGDELLALLGRDDAGAGIERIGRVHVFRFRSGDLAAVLAELCETEANLTVRTGHAVTDVAVREGSIRNVGITGPAGRRELSPAFVIDATGCAAVAALAGAPCEEPPAEEHQLAGFTLRLTGIEGDAALLPILVPYHCTRWVEAGLLPPSFRFTTFAPGDLPGEGFCKLAIGGVEGDDRERAAWSGADSLMELLRGEIPAFCAATIAATSPRVLDREGRTVVGAYRLTAEDILSARKFPDGIVRGSWPMELWDRGKGTLYRYPPAGDWYEIPFRCLTVPGFDNLLAAGRCISATREALGSTRVMGTCLALGEQAGRAAAHRLRSGAWPSDMQAFTFGRTDR